MSELRDDALNGTPAPRARPVQMQLGRELAEFARVATAVQADTGCGMDQAKAEAARLLGVQLPTDDQFNSALRSLGQKFTRSSAGRPPDAFPKSFDAAILSLELYQRGLSRRKSEDAILHLTGVGRSAIDKYRRRASGAMANEDYMAVPCAVAVYADALRARLPTLEQPARGVVHQLLEDAQQPPKSTL